MLTLSKSLIDGTLPAFIAQEEKRGVGPADHAELDSAIKTLATQQRSEDQTSHSSSGGCSTGK